MDIEFDPTNIEHLITAAILLTGRDCWEEAKGAAFRAVDLKPDDANSHMALAQILLANGEFVPGWREYEHRLKIDTTTPEFTSQPWNGMTLPTGRLVVIGGEGYGDTIMFARYIKMAKERVKEVVLGSSLEMKLLLKPLPEITQYHHNWNEVPGHAVHCHINSLPYIFNTTIDTIPNEVPYLWADRYKAAIWKKHLPEGLKIGVCWAGRQKHSNGAWRSMPLADLLPVLKGNATFISLQQVIPEADIEAFRNCSIANHAHSLIDFADTAALIENLDLVITIDSAVAHLAGAMGKPVWIMLPKPADWRWLLNRDDSPWYPTARLFRQQTFNDWTPVIEQIGAELLKM